MNNPQIELVYAIGIVVVLLGLASYFAWRQWQTLRRLPAQENLSREERRYLRNQAWRRLFTSAVMVVLAAMIVGTYLLDQERQAREMGRVDRPLDENGEKAPLNEAEKGFLARYTLFWLVFGLILLGLVILVFIDWWAIRRFARQQFRQIQADRRAMIEHEVAQIRRQRNGF